VRGPSLPDKSRFRAYLRVLGIQSILFVTSYGLCNHLTSMRSTHLSVYFPWELGLPFVPWMIYPYMSLGLVFIVPLFLCGTASLNSINKAFTAALLLSIPAFLAIPAKLGFRPKHFEGHDAIFQFMYTIDPPHNLIPSLHIALSTIIFCAISHEAERRWVSLISILWLALLSVSVVLVRQHHIADVVTGLAFGLSLHYWIYLRCRPKKAVA
jgi:membrane-associated phospholipid phosphatase